MLGVFLDRDSLDCGDLDFDDLDRVLPDLDYYAATGPEQVAARLAEAEVAISNKVVLDAATLRHARRLQLICVAATGVNNVDLEAAARAGVTVCNCRGYGTPAVVQHVFALLLALCARLPEYRRAVRDGRWQRAGQFCLLDYPIRELADKTLGIVGHGELGRGVARVAEAFGMRVLLAQRPGTVEMLEDRTPLPVLLPQVDVLSLHCPLAPETRGLIGAWELALMRRDAVLLNTARGGLVDEAVLAELKAYPVPEGASQAAVHGEHLGVVMPFRMRTPAGVLSFISTVTIFGTAHDVTLQELMIESFFPADALTAQVLRDALA